MSLHSTLEEERVEELVPHPEGYQSVLENKNFLALWIGQILSQLGDRVVFVVFISTIVHHFGASDKLNSFLYIAFTIPAILLTAIAGVFVDRWPRRGILVTTNLLRALFVAFLPWMAAENPWSIFGIAFLVSTATQFFVPAEAATIPTILRKTQLIAANSLFTTTMMASVIFGFALGDPLINIFSLNQVHWAIVGLFLCSSIALMFVKVPPTCSLEAHEEKIIHEQTGERTVAVAFKNFMQEMSEGISYIRETPLILQGMLKLALLFSSVVALCILFVSFAKAYLYTNPEIAARKFAYIITFSGVGMVLGAFFVGRFFRTARRSKMVFGGFTTAGGCLLLLSLIETIEPSASVLRLPAMHFPWVYWDTVHLTLRMFYTYCLVTLMGIGAAFVAIPLQALLHEIIPEDKRGKILGVQFTILSTCSTLPVLIAGLGAEQFGVKLMLWMMGVPLLLVGLYGLYRRLMHPDAASSNW